MPLEYRNFRAWIYCDDDGEILEEYKAAPDPEDERVYTCWIESEAGKRFTVHWESQMKAICDNKGLTFIDGIQTNCYVNTSSSNKDGFSSGVKMGNGEIRPYSFSNVVLTDDDAYLEVEQSTNTEELGNITLKIYLVHARYKHTHRPKPMRPRNREVSLYDGAIHETAKKICDHRITLGDAIRIGPPPRPGPGTRKLIWEPIDRNDPEPYVIFRFNYRPRAFLQAQGIIPTPPCICATPQKPVAINSDNSAVKLKKRKGQKRKRPLMEQGSSQRNIDNGRASTSSELPLFLPTPSLLQSTPHPTRRASDLRPIFFETPCPVKEDEDVVLLGYSGAGQSSSKNRQENADTSTRNVRAKLVPSTPVKVESGGLRLWVDSCGVIDLTVDD